MGKLMPISGSEALTVLFLGVVDAMNLVGKLLLTRAGEDE